MSIQPCSQPSCEEPADSASVELLIGSRAKDLGDLVVRRVLPSSERQRVGPFIFFDQMGPARLAAGSGIDVRPHPHIGLATVTYLFDGVIQHRDSLGSDQAITPGAVNWMTAGEARPRDAVRCDRSRLPARSAETSARTNNGYRQGKITSRDALVHLHTTKQTSQFPPRTRHRD